MSRNYLLRALNEFASLTCSLQRETRDVFCTDVSKTSKSCHKKNSLTRKQKSDVTDGGENSGEHSK